MSYETFAYYYDSLMDLQFYEDYYEFVLKHACFDSVLELGCGTGEIAIRLAKNDKTVYATDLSSDMLEVTKQKAIEENINLMLQCTDMSCFSTSYQFDLVLCLCDSINYLLEEQQILSTFMNAFKSLKSQGTFIFDIDSLHKMNVILKDYHEYEEDDDFIFRWNVELIDDGFVHHYVYIEDRIENEIVEENHYQKTYEVNQYCQWLYESGFRDVQIFSDFQDYKEECERIIFVCRKGEDV